MIECILATDMAQHFAMQKQLDDLVALHSIKDGANGNMVIDQTSDASIFNS